MSDDYIRKTIVIDEETKRLLDEYDVNASEEFRKSIKNKFNMIDMLKAKRDRLEARKKEIVEKLSELQLEKNDIEDELRRLDSLITQNKVFERIESNEDYRVKVQEKASYVFEARKQGDSKEEIECAIEKNAELLVEEEGLPFSVSDVKEVLRKMSKVEKLNNI